MQAKSPYEAEGQGCGMLGIMQIISVSVYARLRWGEPLPPHLSGALGPRFSGERVGSYPALGAPPVTLFDVVSSGYLSVHMSVVRKYADDSACVVVRSRLYV